MGVIFVSLSNELIKQFVKITNDNSKPEKETTVYGTTVEYNGGVYVRLDGSDIITPISSMENANSTVNAKSGERVIVMIKNHHAIITGNVESPAVNDNDMTELTTTLFGESGKDGYGSLMGEEDKKTYSFVDVTKRLTASEGKIHDLETVNLEVKERLAAAEAKIDNAEIGNLDALYAEIDELEATYGEFVELTVEQFEAQQTSIEELNTKKLDAESADIKYANIDFSNIGNAAMEYLYSKSGLIENVVIGDGSITGVLAGVTIKGDTIEGNTIVADKLVIKGEDGLYYKLNTDGVTTESEQTDYNSLNGCIIAAHSITASKINVDDLVAFDATIGGFHITDNSIFTDVKDSDGNTTRGIYMDTDGQFNFGDGTNFVKYYREEDGTYKLAISAESIMYSLNGSQRNIADLGMIGEYVKIGTYEGEPCIELGEKDSDFKLLITNTRILFMEGTAVPAYINNQSLYIGKAVIEEELQQGEFVWKVRSNGNLGLVWKGVNS